MTMADTFTGTTTRADMEDDTEALIAAGWVRRAGNGLEITDKGREALRMGLTQSVPTSFGQPVGIGKQTRIDSPLARSRPHVRPKNKRKR